MAGEVRTLAIFISGREHKFNRMVYLKIVEPKSVIKRENLFQKGVRFLLELVFPKANPDFDERIDSVSEWVLEFKDVHSVPQREIGLDSSGNVILKMPYRDNLGYWVDNNMNYADFQRLFNFSEVSEEYFENKWSSVLGSVSN